MSETQQVGFRFSKELLRSVDTYAREQTKKTGVPYTRADAVRQLLTKAIDEWKKAKK